MWVYKTEMPFIIPDNVIPYTVKKVSFPTFKLNTESTKKYFGHTQYVIPTFKFGETEMSITFEETNNFDVYRFLIESFGGNAYDRSNNTQQLVICLEQYDESMLNIVDKKFYIAILKNFNIPSFNNNGYGSPVEIDATFYIMYVYDEPVNASNEDILKKISNDKSKKTKSPTISNFDDLKTAKTKAAQRTAEQEKENNPKLPSKSEAVEKALELVNNKIEELSGLNVDILFDNLLVPYETIDLYNLAQKNFVEQTGGTKDEFREIFNATAEDADARNVLLLNFIYGINLLDDTGDGLNDEELKIIKKLNDSGNFDDDAYKSLLKNHTEINKLFKEKDNMSMAGTDKVSGYAYERKGTERYIFTSNEFSSYTTLSGKTLQVVRRDAIESSESGRHEAFGNLGVGTPGKKPVTVIEAHFGAENTENGSNGASTETKLKDYNTEGIAAFVGKNGAVDYLADRAVSARSSGSGSDSNKNSSSTLAIEFAGPVAYAKGDDGKIYMRVVTKSGATWKEATTAEQDLIEINSDNTKNKTLLENAERNKGNTTVEFSDGSTGKVTFTNIYSQKYTDEQIEGAEALGYLWAQEGVEIDTENLEIYSHGGTPGYSGGKTEGIDSELERVKEAIIRGYKRFHNIE